VLRSTGAAGTDSYKSFGGLPPMPEMDAWQPDIAVPVSERLQGEFFYVTALGER
ncbi:hypothetical protein PLESTF_000361900, partial [Pleodorina starrii]